MPHGCAVCPRVARCDGSVRQSPWHVTNVPHEAGHTSANRVRSAAWPPPRQPSHSPPTMTATIMNDCTPIQSSLSRKTAMGASIASRSCWTTTTQPTRGIAHLLVGRP